MSITILKCISSKRHIQFFCHISHRISSKTNANIFNQGTALNIINCYCDISAATGNVHFISFNTSKSTVSITKLNDEECFSYFSIRKYIKNTYSYNSPKQNSLENYIAFYASIYVKK